VGGKLPLACGLALAAALVGCRQLVVFDGPDGSVVGTAGSGGTDGGGAGTGGSGGDRGPFCPTGDARTLTASPTAVDVAVLLDRSSGMTARFSDGPTLASAASDALHAVSNRYQATINLSLLMFPGASCSSDTSCCVGTASAPTGPAFSFALDACSAPGACAPTSQRPIAQSLDITYRYFSQNFDPNRYVLLLTSGDPSCAASPGDYCDAAGSVNDLFKINVRTAVVGVGISDGGGCLGKMALAGGLTTAATTTTSSTELAARIDDFIRSVGRDACRLDLRPGPGASDQVVIYQGGAPLQNPSGWEFDGFNHSTVRLHGAACDRLLTNGVADLSIKACPDHH
jgi:hypothetical protein